MAGRPPLGAFRRRHHCAGRARAARVRRARHRGRRARRRRGRLPAVHARARRATPRCDAHVRQPVAQHQRRLSCPRSVSSSRCATCHCATARPRTSRRRTSRATARVSSACRGSLQFHDTGLVLCITARFVGGYRMINYSPLTCPQEPARAARDALPALPRALVGRTRLRVRAVHAPAARERARRRGPAPRRAPGACGRPAWRAAAERALACFERACSLRTDVWIPNYGLAEGASARSRLAALRALER